MDTVSLFQRCLVELCVECSKIGLLQGGVIADLDLSAMRPAVFASIIALFGGIDAVLGDVRGFLEKGFAIPTRGGDLARIVVPMTIDDRSNPVLSTIGDYVRNLFMLAKISTSDLSEVANIIRDILPSASSSSSISPIAAGTSDMDVDMEGGGEVVLAGPSSQYEDQIRNMLPKQLSESKLFMGVVSEVSRKFDDPSMAERLKPMLDSLGIQDGDGPPSMPKPEQMAKLIEMISGAQGESNVFKEMAVQVSASIRDRIDRGEISKEQLHDDLKEAMSFLSDSVVYGQGK